MSTSKATSQQKNAGRAQAAAELSHKRRITMLAVVVAVSIVVLGSLCGVYRASSSPALATSSAASSDYPYQIGRPGPGQQAPDFSLPSSKGGKVSLKDFRGKTVLLYFQEGIDCQPCFDQLTDLERNQAKLKAAHIDTVVSVTSDPVDALALKTKDMGLSTPVLSDPDLAVIKAYDANSYGMMGDSRAGHSFLLIGPDGKIRKRLDYGGAPKYIMFVPTGQLLADLTGAAK